MVVVAEFLLFHLSSLTMFTKMTETQDTVYLVAKLTGDGGYS